MKRLWADRLSSYLQIAQQVLRDARRPLSARAILRHAYSLGFAPDHLYGKTQHKTLQARLSEDILRRRDHSLFFRTKPGQFFLREFLTDPSVPAEYRRPIVARRRTRELFLGAALSVNHKRASELVAAESFSDPEIVETISRLGSYRYVDPKNFNCDDVLLWAASSLIRKGKILSYRVGRYRDDRDHFVQKRSVAFTSLVSETNHTLFDDANLGIVDSALMALSTDLDIPMPEAVSTKEKFEHSFRFFAWQYQGVPRGHLLAFVEIEAPEWFEPVANRLSLNDLRWLDMKSPPNNWDDFDPISQTILSFYFPRACVNG